ncbi:LytR family transcriptional regulator [Myxacorys almedinensis A]|uniref:LytR family transcriptional regulator n=2 Tax=Myxacorys TaxID=2056239 RepID=A0A8J7Z4G2_9CYAN|nr:LCP family protein [Myxacorys almedinensis]NDJ17696.1 LytR family transcriptional regulator [Myxacorys almedinensis A]
MISATAGALLAVSLASTPLMQRQLSPAEASIFGKGEKFSSNTNLRLPELTRPVNILVMGVKVLTSDLANPPEEAKNQSYHALVNSFEGLTDTLLLLRFDPEKRKLSVMSIPRDTRTYIANHGMTKINEANYYGGPALSAKSVSELLGGVGIDRYVTINVQGVEALIEALGGVTVHVPRDMKYQDDSQHLYINLKAGRQHLNGDQTLQLLRFRYDENGDIGRIQRQQMVMRALMEQALNPTTVARFPKILSVIQSHIDTNLTVEELVALVGFGTQINRSNTKMLMVPGEFSSPGEYIASYWLPSPSKIQALMAQHFDFGTSDLKDINPNTLKIAVQDSTEQEKGLQKVMERLKTAGYNNVYEAKPWTEPLRVTRIVAEWGDISSAEAVRRSLGYGEVRIENTGDLQSDVTIQLGKDALQPPKKAASSAKKSAETQQETPRLILPSSD